MMEPHDSTVLGDFSGVEFNADGVQNRFFKKDGKFYINTEGLDGNYQDFEIKYTYGVYPLQQYLVEQAGGRLQTLRATWDSEKNQWFHQHAGERYEPGDWLHWTGSSMTWNTMCSHCHSINVKKNFDNESNTFQSTWDVINVGCEACHGPGKRHVELANRDVPVNADHELDMVVGEMNVTQIENCAPCHSRRSMVKEPHSFTEEFADQYIVSTLRDGLYHADGQILDEVYVYGSFVQSKMYAEGVKCSDCHDPHRAEIKFDGNKLCMQCHEPKYDSKEHHFHDLKTDGSNCIDCHMPGRYYMGNDFRRDHSFRVPRPDLTVRFGTPNTCNGCHDDKTSEWAASTIVEWHGPRPEHFSEILALARERNPEDGELVAQLIRDRKQPFIARATALEYLVESGYEGSYDIMNEMLKDSDPLVRMTAVNQAYNLPKDRRMRIALPLLSDERRIVRIAAASILSDIDPSEIPSHILTDYQKATDEYTSNLFMNGDFHTGQLLIGQYYRRKKDPGKAEEAFLRSLELDSLYIPTRVNLAQLYNSNAENEKAMAILETITKIEPDYPDAYYMRGLIEAETGNLQEASLSLEKAIELSPYNIRAYYNLGLIYQNLGVINDAERAYKNGLDKAPEDESLHNALAILYIQNQQLSQAKPHVEFLYKRYPNNPQIRQMAELVK